MSTERKPSWSLLTAPKHRYVPSYETNLRKSFADFRWKQEQARRQREAEPKPHALRVVGK